MEVVPYPKGRKIVDCKWVFKHKLDANRDIARYKARLIAKGYTQVKGTDYDETYTPVASYDSLRFLLAIAAHYGWIPLQFDVKSAFLYGDLNENIYMTLPSGYREVGHYVKLKECIYGLKQSPQE